MAGLHYCVEAGNLLFADTVGDRRVADENFVADDTAFAAGDRQQLLGDDSPQNERELRADLALLVRREHIDNTVDCLGGVCGVQGAENQMAGFSHGAGGRYRFKVAHFADENDVGVFAKNASEGFVERLGVDVQFTLVDDRTLMVMQVFDRVFDGHDVAAPGLVDDVDQTGQ